MSVEPLNPYLDIAPEVSSALESGQPVVALESTIISHGMPFPRNVETALSVENAVREAGAVPATIALIGGRIRVGGDDAMLVHLAEGPDIAKASRRDLAPLVAAGRDGATTVSGCGSKVISSDRTSSARAFSTTRSRIARCPRWTPS